MIPAWHDKPTEPGLWLCESNQRGVTGWRVLLEDVGDKFWDGSSRYYGPIPPDTARYKVVSSTLVNERKFYMANKPTTTGQRPATLIYFEDKAGKHRWRMLSSNGRIICASSQGYTTLIDAQKNAMLLGALLSGYNGGYGDRLFVGANTGEVKLWK